MCGGCDNCGATVRSSEDNYQIHLTVAPVGSLSNFRKFCLDNNIEPLKILNFVPNGEHYIENITNTKIKTNDYISVFEKMYDQKELFEKNGFIVSRMKIEESPFNRYWRRFEIDHDPKKVYFEYHIKIKTVGIIHHISNENLNLSMNIYKPSAMFITQRIYGGKVLEVISKIKDNLSLEREGFRLLNNGFFECVQFDSNPDADANWIRK